MGRDSGRANPLLMLAACIDVVMLCVLVFDRIVRPRIHVLRWLA